MVCLASSLNIILQIELTDVAVWPPYQPFPLSDFFYKNESATTSKNRQQGSYSVPRLVPRPLQNQTADLKSTEASIIRIGDGSVSERTHHINNRYTLIDRYTFLQ